MLLGAEEVEITADVLRKLDELTAHDASRIIAAGNLDSSPIARMMRDMRKRQRNGEHDQADPEPRREPKREPEPERREPGDEPAIVFYVGKETVRYTLASIARHHPLPEAVILEALRPVVQENHPTHEALNDAIRLTLHRRQQSTDQPRTDQ